MKLGTTVRRVLPLVMCVFIAPAFAEGPLNVGGPFDIEGVAFRWNPAIFPLTYWTDLGNLGSQTNTQADQLVNDAFTVWDNVTTASISFNAAGELGGDVTEANAPAVISAIEGCAPLPAGGIARDRSIIYDTDGSIVDAILGVGNSDTTLGFATPTCLTSDGIENSYTRGYAVMNGKGNPSGGEISPVMIHEFGHMLGLDHSQINVECLGFFGCSDDDSTAGLPTMFPILVDTAAMSTPATDDIAGISALYPETVNDPPNGRVPFATTTGRITGRIFFSDGVTQAQSFNVIARMVDTPGGVNESKRTAVSSVSGFLFTADNGNPIIQIPGLTPSLNGTRDTNFAGYYEIPGLPPGNYTVEIEAIDSSFTLGSGLGPVGGFGIVFPMPSATCPDGEFFDSGEADDDICTNSSSVPVVANTTVTGRDIILNGTPTRYDAYEDGP